MMCSNCGKPLNPNAKFCGICGAPVQSPPEGEQRVYQTNTDMHTQGVTGTAAGGTAVIGGLNMKWVGAAVFVVIIVVASLLVNGSTGSAGRSSSPQQIADMLTSNYGRIFADDFDDDAIATFAGNYLDSMPDEVVDKAMEESGYTRDEAIDEVADGIKSSLDSYEDILDSVSMSFTVNVGDQLDSDDIDDIEDALSDNDIDLDITDGYELEATVTVTAKEDIGRLEKGETDTETTNVGAQAICVDGRWYLWADVL